jgi:hypothetical protein
MVGQPSRMRVAMFCIAGRSFQSETPVEGCRTMSKTHLNQAQMKHLACYANGDFNHLLQFELAQAPACMPGPSQ